MEESCKTRSPFRLVRPLFYLAVTGIAVFLLYKWGSSKHDVPEIFVSRAHIEGLRQEHLRRTGSLPTPDEEKALVRMFIDNEVLVREARKMGLDQGDPVVRRRLVQKMEFLLEDFYTRTEPTRAELQEYFDQVGKIFFEPSRVSLTHVFLNRDRSSEDLESGVPFMLEKLSAGVDPEGMGDPFLTGNRFQHRTRKELAAVFGSPFAEAVIDLPRSVWSGPIESSYGHHLVRIDSRTEARQPDLDEVRSRVVKQWKAGKREEAKGLEVRRLRNRYDIRFVGDGVKNPDS